MLNTWDIIIFIGSVVVFFLIYSWRKVHFMQRKGVKAIATFPIIGNLWKVFRRKVHSFDVFNEVYSRFKEEKYFAFYQFHMGFLVLKDLEIIKQISVKDFDYFTDRTTLIDEDIDPLFGSSLVALKGRKWREMRATLSPVFTSSKMRNMFVYVEECGKYTAEFYTEKMETESLDVFEVELKELFTRYGTDVIATSVFGIKVDSLKDENNEFNRMAKMATKFTFIQTLKVTGIMIMPKLMKFLKVTLFSPILTNFFKKLVVEQMKYREENNIIRQDMIHLLMKARKGSLRHENNTETEQDGFATVEESQIGTQQIQRKWNDNEIAGQAIAFFFAGLETISTLLSFMCNELALNLSIQQRLQEEIDELALKCDGNPTYDDIQSMKYMDMVVSETLRKWPTGFVTDRQCIKTYTFPANHGKAYTMKPGESAWIPIYGIHRDPQYYPNPDVFDPERFSAENRGNIQPLTYLPFGLGPRNCIGSRFALMEVKSAAFHMLLKFDFVKTAKTADPLILGRKEFLMKPDDGFWIGLKRR